jgi:hypothetical protein
MGYYGEIMTHEETGHWPFLLNRDKQIQDLGLHRSVERTRRFIEQQDIGLKRNGPGNCYALALSPGQLMRKAEAKSRTQSNLIEHRLNALIDILEPMQFEAIGEDTIYCVAWIE